MNKNFLKKKKTSNFCPYNFFFRISNNFLELKIINENRYFSTMRIDAFISQPKRPSQARCPLLHETFILNEYST